MQVTIQPKTGYIRINRFGATTAEEFNKSLKELQKKGMKDLILIYKVMAVVIWTQPLI